MLAKAQKLSTTRERPLVVSSHAAICIELDREKQKILDNNKAKNYKPRSFRFVARLLIEPMDGR